MKLPILEFEGSRKTKKSKYLESENKKLTYHIFGAKLLLKRFYSRGNP